MDKGRVSNVILVFEDNDVSLFDSVATMRRYLEPIDVRQGIFSVFRSDGCRGVLTVTNAMNPQMGDIDVQFESNDQVSREELARLLRGCFAAMGLVQSVDPHDLLDAVLKLWQHVGFTR